MGSADGGLDEKPVHLVQLDPFYLCKYELTVSEYVQFLNESGAVYENTSAVHAHIYGNKGNPPRTPLNQTEAMNDDVVKGE